MTDAELLAHIRRLARDFPFPDSRWHAYVSLIQDVVDDLNAASDAIGASPRAATELARLIEQERFPAVEPPGPALAAAGSRLRELPVPDGEHPYVDEIRLALEAAAAAIAALSSVPGGEQAFEAARRSLRPRG